MRQKKYNVIGVMSGTSLDGLDIAYIEFVKNKEWSFRIIRAETLKYTPEWYARLKNAIYLDNESLSELDHEYSVFTATSVLKFIDDNRINNLDVVCSHGHTVYHQPEKGITLQMGNKEILADILNLPVVCDFRVQDVQLGGQGAPLVPIGDELLFSEYDYCLNLGGFANISINVDGERIAYDICPVNIVLNHYASFLGLDYDRGGKLASQGSIDAQLLEDLNNLPYYKRHYPKSLGYEWVQEGIFKLINGRDIQVMDVLRTFTEHIVCQLIKNLVSGKSLFVTGGGAYNTFLMRRLNELSEVQIVIPSTEIIEFKEAMIFGFLGVLKMRNETNALASVTGAIKNHSSGKVFYPKND